MTVPPQKQLASIVSHIAVIENSAKSTGMNHLPFYADGFPGLLFQQAEEGMFMNGGSSPLPPLFVYGQTIKPIVLSPMGSFRILVFYFYPATLSTLFGISPSEIRDSCINLQLLPSYDFQFSVQEIFDARKAHGQIAIICHHLSKQLQSKTTQADYIISYALEEIWNSNGQSSLFQLRRHLNVTERTFERRFEHLVGVSPKLFSRVCQFRSTINQLHKKDFVKLSDLAYDNGYSDQSHFIRSFKEFTGSTPLEYLKAQRDGIRELV